MVGECVGEANLVYKHFGFVNYSVDLEFRLVLLDFAFLMEKPSQNFIKQKVPLQTYGIPLFFFLYPLPYEC
jgi:hypothetical protein